MVRQLIKAVLFGSVVTGCATSPALHVIGVYEGQVPPGADEVFIAKCHSSQNASDATEMAPPKPKTLEILSIECSKIYADLQAKREVSVNVTDDSRPIVLALSAYDKTLWRVSLKQGVKLKKVILSGYHSQQITGIPPETPVEVYTYEPSPCAQCWQSSKYFYSYQRLPKQLKEITGIDAASFQGRYSGAEFYIFPGMKQIDHDRAR